MKLYLIFLEKICLFILFAENRLFSVEKATERKFYLKTGKSLEA